MFHTMMSGVVAAMAAAAGLHLIRLDAVPRPLRFLIFAAAHLVAGALLVVNQSAALVDPVWVELLWTAIIPLSWLTLSRFWTGLPSLSGSISAVLIVLALLLVGLPALGWTPEWASSYLEYAMFGFGLLVQSMAVLTFFRSAAYEIEGRVRFILGVLAILPIVAYGAAPWTPIPNLGLLGMMIAGALAIIVGMYFLPRGDRGLARQALFGSVSSAMVMLSPEGVVTEVNQQGIRLLGDIKATEGLAKTFPELPELVNEAIGGSGVVVENILRHGPDQVYEVEIRPVEADDRLSGWLVEIRDISERQVADQTLLRAQDELAKSNANSNEVLATLGHELRTPLTAMIGYADIVHDEASDSVKDSVRLIQRSGQRLMATLNSVLEMARLDAGQLPVQSTAMDVRPICKDVVDLLQLRASDSGVTLRLAPGDSGIVKIDEGSFARIMTNLIENGIKFTAEGEVVVSIDREEGFVVIRVADSGPGIAPEDLPQIFEPFSRIESSDSARLGVGLGLSIVKRLTQLMDGAIRVDSQLGTGSVFEVRFREEQETHGDEQPAWMTAGSDPKPEARRILCLDPQNLFTDQLISGFGSDFDVERVDDADSVLRASRGGDFETVFIAVDPLRTQEGIELMLAMRAFGDYGDRPIIAVSDAGSCPDLRRAGFTNCVTAEDESAFAFLQ